MQYTPIFHSCKNDNFQMKNGDILSVFVQNIDRGYTLEPLQALLTSTHDLCFNRAEIREKYIPLQTHVLLYKDGV